MTTGPKLFRRPTKMGRLGQRKHVSDVQREFAGDFTVINDSLLLCKFCDTVVNWKKKTRIYEHLQTRMHSEKKEAKLTSKQKTRQNATANANSVTDLTAEEPASTFHFSQELDLQEQELDPSLASAIFFSFLFFFFKKHPKLFT